MTALYLHLSRLRAELRTATSRQEGQALIEYVLIVTLIALVAITALQTTGTDVRAALNTIASEA